MNGSKEAFHFDKMRRLDKECTCRNNLGRIFFHGRSPRTKKKKRGIPSNVVASDVTRLTPSYAFSKCAIWIG